MRAVFFRRPAAAALWTAALHVPVASGSTLTAQDRGPAPSADPFWAVGRAVDSVASVRQDARPVTVEDVLAFRSPGKVSVSPDGRRVAYVVSERDFEENQVDSEVWVASTDGGDPVRLTRHPGSDSDPRWAPDGSWLAFRSDRGE